MRDLFMAVYFTAVGLNLDVHAVVVNWWIIALALPIVQALKAGVIGVGTWAAGSTAPTAVQTGLTLAQAGEFSLVILAAAGPKAMGGEGIIPEQALGAVIAVVVLSLILTPALFQLGVRLKPRFGMVPAARWIIRPGHHGGKDDVSSPPEIPPGKDGERRHIIIAGFGVVGRNLAEHIAASGVPFTVIELNPATVRRQRELGRSILFGDVANAEVLQSAGIHSAEAILLTVPDDDATLRACRTIRALAPDIFIAARTSYLSRAIVATELGADHVTVEEVATAREMAEQVMRRIGHKPGVQRTTQ
jgi:CPA2 family monovalent cation:H+ antiporter-2